MVLEWHEILLACIRGVHKLAPTICARYAFITQASRVIFALARHSHNLLHQAQLCCDELAADPGTIKNPHPSQTMASLRKQKDTRFKLIVRGSSRRVIICISLPAAPETVGVTSTVGLGAA